MFVLMVYYFVQWENKREKENLPHFSRLIKLNCSGLWEFKVGLAGRGFADSSRMLCIDPCTIKCRTAFLKMQSVSLDIATCSSNIKRHTGEEGSRRSRTTSSVRFFPLTERQISKKDYHTVTAHLAERLFKARRGGGTCMWLCMGRWMVM